MATAKKNAPMWTKEEILIIMRHVYDNRTEDFTRKGIFTINHLIKVDELASRLGRTVGAVRSCWLSIRNSILAGSIYANSYSNYVLAKEARAEFINEQETQLKPKESSNFYYDTRDKNYEGCHPIIEGNLKAHKNILCELWDDDTEDVAEDYVTDYRGGDAYPYITPNEYYRHAKPVKHSRYLKSVEEILQECFKLKYVVVKNKDVLIGWMPNKESKETIAITTNMLVDCGATSSTYVWPEWAWEVRKL